MNDQIQADLKQAQRDHDELKLGTLRMLLSEIKYAEIAKGEALAEADILGVIQKELKKRKEAAEGFRNGGRAESAEKEEAEAQVLLAYMPTQLSDEELSQIINDVITQTGASSVQDMGRVIGQVMAKVGSQAEGSRVSNLVKQQLAS